MSCSCAREAVGCMPKPGVADLCCVTKASCCEPGPGLSDIPDAVVVWWDENGTLDGAPIEDVDADTLALWLGLLEQYTAAICLAHEKLAGAVCMAKYAATCCVKVGVCIEAPCCCTCTCKACPTCDREAVRLDKMCVTRDRVADVTIDGESVLDSDGPVSVEWMDGVWRLYGPKTGTFEVCFELADPSVSWTEAVKSFACDRVPCQHTAECNTEEARAYRLNLRSLGITGNDLVDDLDTECCAPGVVFGRPRRAVRYVRWGDCE